MAPKQEVYEQIFRSNIAKSRKISELEQKLANAYFSLDRVRKRNAELEEQLRLRRDAEQSDARRKSWDAIVGVVK